MVDKICFKNFRKYTKMNLAIENSFTAVITKLSKLSLTKLMVFSFILNSGILISFSLLSDDPEIPPMQFHSLTEKIFVVVLAGPLVETTIFQYFIVEYSKKYLNSFLAGLLISSVIFGLCHFYSVNYIIATFFSGLVMGGLYIILKIKNSYPFLLVFILHAAHNLLSTILNVIFYDHF